MLAFGKTKQFASYSCLSRQSTWNGIYFQLDYRLDLRTLLSFSTYLFFTGVSNDFDRLGVIRDISISHYEFIIGAYVTPRSDLLPLTFMSIN